MKAFKFNKVQTFLLACILCLAAIFGATLGYALAKPVNATAATLSSEQYQTDGASVRVFKRAYTAENKSQLVATDQQGIRFHVEMGAEYAYEGKTIIDKTEMNANGSYKIRDGFKTYTLVLPERLLNGDLTVNSDKVMKLDTSGYWYSDGDGNLESVAFVYELPKKFYTDKFVFRGVICTVDGNGNETVVRATDTSTKILAEVAKYAYWDTKEAIDDNNDSTTYWGSAENDNTAVSLIKEFIPTYNITYQVAGKEDVIEEVFWGETPKSVPKDGPTITDEHLTYEVAWYNEEKSQVVNLNEPLKYEENVSIVLKHTSALNFNLTGVADYNNFTVAGKVYSGTKLYATIPVADLYSSDEIATGTSKMIALDEQALEAVKVEYVQNPNNPTGSFSGLQGVWTLMEGTGAGAQLRLIFAFDSSKMVSGDKLIIKGDSLFYFNGVMYKLTDDYSVDYTLTEVDGSEKEDYGVFLGYLHNSDIQRMENWEEEVSNGDTRLRIRITFYDDILINSDFKIVYKTDNNNQLPAGYTYPLYTKCNDTGAETEITEGYFYWNQGEHSILELNGYAYHNNDELFGAPGLMIVQNGGYYIYEDAIYAYFNGTEWVVGSEKGTFGTSAFESIGINYTAGTEEVRFTTTTETTLADGTTKTDRWFDAVRQMYVENMSESEPYAVYHTAADGKTVTELTEFIFHGQDDTNSSKDYNHIFGIRNFIGKEAGEKVTIIAGTRFWYGSEYFTASEDINFYYNGVNWIVGSDGTADEPIAIDNFRGQNFEFYEENTNKIRMYLNSAVFNDAFGPLTIESGSVKIDNTAYTNLYYHGGGYNIFEIVGNETGDVTKTLGKTAFETTLTIEKGTRLWMGTYCIEFSEEVQWIYVGGNHNAHAMYDRSTNLGVDWVPDVNTNVTRADITKMYNETDAGGQVRVGLKAGILTNSYTGFVIIDKDKGIPVVNGNGYGEHAFFFGNQHNLFEIRGGEGTKSYGTKVGDYIVIPKGSVWWTAQGKITFTEEIRGVFGTGWNYGFNTDQKIGEILSDNIQRVFNEGSDEIRIQLPLGYADTYYGPIAIDGQNQDGSYDVTLQKADGTITHSMYAYWYGGNSKTYTANHSLFGIQGAGVGVSNGDILTIRKDTKFIFHTATGTEGYYTFDKDVAYVYENGMWRSADGWDVTFNLGNATASLNGNALQSGEAISLYSGAYNVTITPNSGYSITRVNGATNNLDGTYTINVGSNMTVEVITKQSIKLAANAVSTIFNHAEQDGSGAGVRINLSEETYPALNNIVGVSNYGATMNGATSLTLGLSSAQFTAGSTYNYFGKEADSLLELRFDTTKLVVGDTFKIAKGTVFNHDNMAYAIEFTEDIVGFWTGSGWILNPVKKGDLDWDSAISRVISYSDFNDTTNEPLNHTIRIYLKEQEQLFDGASGQGLAAGNVTIDGTQYTDVWRYHGAQHRIVEIGNWYYAKDQVLVIEKGTKIFIGSNYYETTKTLTATCQADGSDAVWIWETSL